MSASTLNCCTHAAGTSTSIFDIVFSTGLSNHRRRNSLFCSLAGASTPDSNTEFAGGVHAVAGPISAVRLVANRLNAQLSSGPVTDTGKEIVSRNAIKHGLTGAFRVAPDESQEDFDALLAGFMQAEEPADQEEVQYVQYMAEATWLSRRAVRLQDQAILTMQCGTPEEKQQAGKDLGLFMRYMTTHDRAYSRYATELRKHRNDRIKAERGFVSQKHKEAADQRRQDLHQARQTLQHTKLEAQEIRNRVAAAKAEALELKNLTRRSQVALQNPERALAAAA